MNVISTFDENSTKSIMNASCWHNFFANAAAGMAQTATMILHNNKIF